MINQMIGLGIFFAVSVVNAASYVAISQQDAILSGYRYLIPFIMEVEKLHGPQECVHFEIQGENSFVMIQGSHPKANSDSFCDLTVEIIIEINK